MKFLSLKRIGAIATNTLLELVRLKVFYFLLLFALLIIGSSVFMVKFTFQEQFQVLKDVSLGAMSIFTWMLSVLATAMLLPKDIEDRTLYTILAKPVPRLQYLLGKLSGVLLLLLLSTVLMSLMFAAALFLRQQQVIAETLSGAAGIPADQMAETIRTIKASAFAPNLAAGVMVIYIKAALFAALTLFISTYATSSIFTVIVSVMVYFIGHVQGTAREYWLAAGDASVATKFGLGAISVVFPDMQLFNLVDDIAVGNALQSALFMKTCGLGLLYLVIYLLAAYFVFAKKEL